MEKAEPRVSPQRQSTRIRKAGYRWRRGAGTSRPSGNWVLYNYSLDPRAIQLEITETSVMDDPEDAKTKFEVIRNMGVRLSIDDFGTGYSSLRYLKNLTSTV